MLFVGGCWQEGTRDDAEGLGKRCVGLSCDRLGRVKKKKKMGIESKDR